jgi:hypothetical protein
MNDPIWKLMPKATDQKIDVVWRRWPDGHEESCLVTTEKYVRWLADGNEPLPPDEELK